jgi:DNA end-binding protein Ku
MRAIWSGSINFGLVNIPVHIYSGTEPHDGLDLDLLHAKDHAPIRYARICRQTGEEVPWDQIVKGYEYKDGDYVVLTKEDFKRADPEKTSSLDIEQFINPEDIDERYFEKPYFLEPGKGADKAYALLREALQKTGKQALVKYVMRQREHIGSIKPMGRALILLQLRYMSDLREGTGLKFPTGKNITKAELEMASQLIGNQTKPFAPEDYHDTYTEELEEVIEEKAKGKRPKKTVVKKESQTKDLMAALKASLNQKE